MTRETVGSVGEFGLIDRITKSLPSKVRSHPSMRVGIGDDTAVWQPTPGEQLLVTTDALVERIHFDLDWQDWESLGWKSLAVNVSDIAAMGGRPALATFTLGLQAEVAVDDILAFYRGAARLAEASGMLIAGGDIVRSPECLSIGVTVVGETRDGRFLSRSGAQVGDLIAVSGTIGAAAAGLKLLQLPDDDPRRHAATAPALIDALLEPQPRVELGELLLASGASAAMDLSDGLLGDLPKILSASQVSAELQIADLPVASSVRALFPHDWLSMALSGGEDYELVFTASQEAYDAISGPANDFHQMVTVIGRVVEADTSGASLRMFDESGNQVPHTTGAFTHF
ncbi:MAG: thiamine-phosphate kinase [Thermomicrobiales bacterium]|nr:thiamine-phosphate kinase [Thermomicrobiales bacterium]